MQIRTIRKVGIAVASTSLALTLSGCAAGNDAPTRMTTQVTDGVDGSINTYGSDIRVKSALIVAQPDGSGVLVGTIINGNSHDDALIAIAAGGVNGTLGQTSYPVTLDAPLRFEGDSKNALATFDGLNATPGNRVKVQLFFGRAGELILDAIVREKSGIYENVGS